MTTPHPDQPVCSKCGLTLKNEVGEQVQMGNGEVWCRDCAIYKRTLQNLIRRW